MPIFDLQLAGLNDEPPGDEDSLKTGPLLEESRSQEPWDADDPRNYLPPSIVADPAFHNDQPLKFGTSQPPQQPAKPDENPDASPSVETSKDVVLVDPSNAGEECLPNVPESEMPQMKPLPEGKPIPSSSSSSSGNLADMALQVALEVEEKRKKEVRDKLIQVGYSSIHAQECFYQELGK